MRRLQPFIAISALLVALTAWAFASPVGSSPDEDHHLVSIWCAGGEYPGLCESTDSATTRMVSPALLYSSCFGHDPSISATCQTVGNVFTSQDLDLTDRGNFYGGYPGGYFSVMRVFATPDIQSSVVLMRVLNSVLFCAVLAAIALLARPRVTRLVLIGAVLTMVPVGLFTIASINPSSWAFIAVYAAFIGTFEAFHALGRRRIALAALAGFGVVLAGAARYDALGYAILGVLAAAFLATTIRLGRRGRLTLLAFAVIGGGILATVGQPAIRALMYSAGTGGQQGASPISVFFYNVAMLPDLFVGFSGGNGLGWLDTAMPYATWMVASFLLWAVLFTRLRALPKKVRLAAAVTGGLLIAVPMAVLQLNNATVGQNVQARYLFPLLLILVLILLVGAPTLSVALNRIQRVLIFLGLALGQALAMVFNMSRYILGGTFPSTADLDAAARTGWWWSVGPSPMLVLATAALAFAAFLLLSLFNFDRSARVSSAVGRELVAGT